MKKKNILVYILIGILGTAAFVAGWALVDLLLGNTKTYTDGLKNVLDWVLGVFFGASLAVFMWKKGDKDSGK